MNFGFIGAFILFTIIISYNLKKQARKKRRDEEDFWARESRANSVCRKSLDGLVYIPVPLEQLPTHLLNDNSTVLECIETLEEIGRASGRERV